MKIKRLRSRENRKIVANNPCAISNHECQGRIDPDHIKTWGSGAGDEIKGMMPLCSFHHTMKGRKGIIYMADTYKDYYQALVDRDFIDYLEFKRQKMNNFRS